MKLFTSCFLLLLSFVCNAQSHIYKEQYHNLQTANQNFNSRIETLHKQNVPISQGKYRNSQPTLNDAVNLATLSQPELGAATIVVSTVADRYQQKHGYSTVNTPSIKTKNTAINHVFSVGGVLTRIFANTTVAHSR